MQICKSLFSLIVQPHCSPWSPEYAADHSRQSPPTAVRPVIPASADADNILCGTDQLNYRVCAVGLQNTESAAYRWLPAALSLSPLPGVCDNPVITL